MGERALVSGLVQMIMKCWTTNLFGVGLHGRRVKGRKGTGGGEAGRPGEARARARVRIMARRSRARARE